MRILVTGGAGFIGSHFIRAWLAARPDSEVVNLDALTYAGSLDRLADVAAAPGYRHVRGSICDAKALRGAMAGCDTVAHFAAETHVDRSITDAAPFLRTNVEGTALVLEAARAAGVRRILHVSTDEVYGPVPEGEVDERAPLSPRSPYAASKAAADLLAQAYYATHGVPVLIVRPTNIFGPWQLPEKFIPLCIANCCDGLPVPIYGDGQQRRSWLYIQDACRALLTLAADGLVGDVYNLAGGHEQANLDTARQIALALGAPAERLQPVADRPAHDRRYAMHDAKLRTLGWRPATPFNEALAETIRWYQAHERWWRPLAIRLREDPYHWLNRPARPGARPAALGVR